jgi:hypothetical protein
MSFGSTLTLTINSVSKVLNKINQDGYGSEYLLRSATEEYRAKVRHSIESAKNGKEPFERHQVEVTQTIFATDTTPEIVRDAYIILRVRASDAASTGTGYLVAGFVDYLDSSTVQGDVLSWQS